MATDLQRYAMAQNNPQPKLGTTGTGPKRIPNKRRPSETDQEGRPSDRMAQRQEEAVLKKSLAEKLMEASAALPPATGPYTQGLQQVLGGAAAGATLGEAIAGMQQEKAKRKGAGKKKPATLSEKATEVMEGKDVRRVAGK